MKKITAALAGLVLGSTAQTLMAQMWISEFMAAGGTLKDEDGDTPNWIELWNTGTNSVNLGGWHLTDKAHKLTEWTFPATNVGCGQFLVVFASGKDRAVAGATLHTNFKLSRTGEYLALVEADGKTIAHQYSPAYPPQAFGVSYGLESNTPTGTWAGAYLVQPTPEATNSAAYVGLVADTQVSMPSGFVEQPFTVALSTATEGAHVFFTTNGAAPTTETGILYAGPVPITRNTVLRAVATKPGYRSTTVATRTYLYLTNAITQSYAAATNAGFPATWTGGSALYGMNPSVVIANWAQMGPSLMSLPSVLLSTSVSNLFDPTNGIYSHPLNHGAAWERPAAIEWLDTNGQSAFQVDCGLRIHGEAGRGDAQKAFRLLFKNDYAGALNCNLFQESGAATNFHNLVLRTGFKDSWYWATGLEGKATYLRDEFGRRLMLDMGHPSPRGRFVHLYINGLYWGLYSVTERPDADFSRSYLGGVPNDWDAIKANLSRTEAEQGDTQSWSAFKTQAQLVADPTNYQKLQGCNFDGSINAQYPVLMDKSNYIDYLILNYRGGNWDWPDNNYWLGWNRAGEGTGFKCYVWDFEGTVDDARSPLHMIVPQDTVSGTDDIGVAVPHHYLKKFSEYKLDFADRVQRHFFNGGLLTPQVLTNRFRELAVQIESAILAQSARWGSGNETQNTWRGERNYILTTYLPQRTAIVLGQFVAAGLYPSVGAPALGPSNGARPSGYNLVLTQSNATGVIYFTLDGSDPRLFGLNTPSPTAQVFTAPLTLTVPTLVHARVLQGTQWSALLEINAAPGSVPWFSGISANQNNVVLEFPASAGQSYTLLWTPQLSAGWSKLVDLPAQPTNQMVTLTNSLRPEAARFFRLVSPSVP